MRTKRVKQMLDSGLYDEMSVSEFSRAVKDSERVEEFDVDVWADETLKIIPDYMNNAIAEGVKNERA